MLACDLAVFNPCSLLSSSVLEWEESSLGLQPMLLAWGNLPAADSVLITGEQKSQKQIHTLTKMERVCSNLLVAQAVKHKQQFQHKILIPFCFALCST